MQRYSPVVKAFLFIFVVSSKAADNTPPHFVYRADFRDYEHLFASGFKTLGRNDNLEDHIRGISCQDGELKNSAFTATTSEEEFAIKWAGDRLWMRENYASNQFVYVYKIRASENFYCSYSSLMKAFEDTKEKPYKRLADFFKSEKEWVAYKGIPSDQVRKPFCVKFIFLQCLFSPIHIQNRTLPCFTLSLHEKLNLLMFANLANI